MRTVLLALALCLLPAFIDTGASAQSGAAASGPASFASARLAAVCGRAAEFGCYANHKYGYVLAWPKRYLTPGGESDSGDGQRFASGDGRSSMACWGSYHGVVGTSLKDAFDEAASEPGADVSYKHLGRDFFVVSGMRDGMIFYRKTIRSGDVEASFELLYTPSLKAAFDPIVKDVAGAFVIDAAFSWR